MTVEKIADGVLLMSGDKDFLIAVSKYTANQELSNAAVSYGKENKGFLIYNGAMSAIPLYELSRSNDSVRGFIISEDSLRATLCGNYPEYVKSYNMTAPPETQIKDTDAPPYLFLQKQLDFAADETQSEVADFQAEHGIFDDVLELER